MTKFPLLRAAIKRHNPVQTVTAYALPRPTPGQVHANMHCDDIDWNIRGYVLQSLHAGIALENACPNCLDEMVLERSSFAETEALLEKLESIAAAEFTFEADTLEALTALVASVNKVMAGASRHRHDGRPLPDHFFPRTILGEEAERLQLVRLSSERIKALAALVTPRILGEIRASLDLRHVSDLSDDPVLVDIEFGPWSTQPGKPYCQGALLHREIDVMSLVVHRSKVTDVFARRTTLIEVPDWFSFHPDLPGNAITALPAALTPHERETLAALHGPADRGDVYANLNQALAAARAL